MPNWPYEGVAVMREVTENEVGWCHNCGTFQLASAAPWVEISWVTGEPQAAPCCVNCREAEPWELGVFPMPAEMRSCAEQKHESWAPIPCETCGATAPA